LVKDCAVVPAATPDSATVFLLTSASVMASTPEVAMFSCFSNGMMVSWSVPAR